MSPTREGVFVRNSRSVGVPPSSCRYIGCEDDEEERRDGAEGSSWEMSRMDGPVLTFGGVHGARAGLQESAGEY